MKAVTEQLLDLADENHNDVLSVAANCFLGTTLMFRGELQEARQRLETGLDQYSGIQTEIPGSHSALDPGLVCHIHNALTLWSLGYPDKALHHAESGLALAERLRQPYNIAFALVDDAALRFFRRDWDDFHNVAQACFDICREHNFPHWLAIATVHLGASLTLRGAGEAGIAQIRQGIKDFQASGAGVSVTFMYAQLGDAYLNTNQMGKGLAAFDKGLDIAQKTRELWWYPELLRGKGELLLQQAKARKSPGDYEQAQSCFCDALKNARQLAAKSLELRAATSLAGLWCEQGEAQKAHELLAPIYNWFSEGFDTADLIDARKLLDEIA